MSRNQLNIRVSDELEELIDKKRIALATEMKIIPTRSDVVRYALADYLKISLEKTDYDHRSSVETKQVKTKGKSSK
jgi:Arc/MetJ-type ribon-helix-helix transcriptional regulator